MALRSFPFQSDKSPILGPLKFELPQSTNVITCLLCDEKFDLNTDPNGKVYYLQHLLEIHKLVIGDVEQVVDFESYNKYWKFRFQDDALTTYCTVMQCSINNDPKQIESYYLLSDVLREDKTLRQELKMKYLENILSVQLKEKNDRTYSHECWFCHTKYEKISCLDYLSHLYEDHNLHVGQPSRLVFITEMIELIEDKLNRFHCLFCDKIFKDRAVLKEHMRKKLHKRINPNDKAFDRFYIVNYLEQNERNKIKDSKLNKKPVDNSDEEDDVQSKEASEIDNDSEWSQWNERYELNIVCLFCSNASDSFERSVEHMNNVHGYDFNHLTQELGFYDKMRLVNYIRRQIHLLNCVSCNIHFLSSDNLLKHMHTSNHFHPTDKTLWAQVEYYFPTYEDDQFLYFLDDLQTDDTKVDEVVQPEDG